jgi:hypothetical protein
LQPNYLNDTLHQGELVYWNPQRRPIRVYLANGEDLPGYTPEMRQWVWEALNAWGTAVAPFQGDTLPLAFVAVDSPEAADWEVYWTTQSLASRQAEFANATCQRTIRNGQVIVHALINLGLRDPYTGQPFNQAQLQRLAMHEAGHALGLGHSPNPGDVMYANLHQSSRSGRMPVPGLSDLPTPRDAHTLALLLYAADTSALMPIHLRQGLRRNDPKVRLTQHPILQTDPKPLR